MCPVLQVFKKRNYSAKQAEKVTFAFQAYPWHTHAAFDCLKWYETASFSKRVHAKNLRLWDARGFEISGRHFRRPLSGVWRGGGGGGGTYVPSLNFKYGRFAFWREDHVPVGIQPIFMSFVAISSNTLLCKRRSETLPSGFTASVYTVII